MSASAPPTTAATSPGLAQRLGRARVDLRSDLQIFRHVFRGKPSYVVRDPTSMQSHRFGAEDYRIFVRISSEKSLAEIFRTLVAERSLHEEDEDEFYRFILTLHNLAFLNLPVSDDRSLYRRFVAKQRARRVERVLGFLSLKIPVWNPDDFLERTVRYTRWLFGRAAFAVWCVAMAACAAFVANNWREIASPQHGILEVGNLPVLWGLLVVLKVAHEFGHAYACKARGGSVPEMGIMLILMTPLAYVDATSAWGFVRRRDRIVVSLAGMYVESIIAAVALAVWASTPSAGVRVVAHDVLLLATVVTIALNANPLMRFDGYYVLSDLVEIPNLRARSEHCVRSVFKEVCFGIDDPVPETGRRLRMALFAFGIAAAIYRIVLVTSIALLVATKAFLLGMVFAVGYLGNQLLRLVRGLVNYLWRSPETSAQRRRAVTIGGAVLVGMPLLALLVPVPGSVHVPGVVGRENEMIVRAEQAGFLARMEVRGGEAVAPGAMVAQLENPALRGEVAEAEAGLEVARLQAAAYRAERSSRAVPEEEKVRARRAELAERERALASLEVRSPAAGAVVAALPAGEAGRFVEQGEPIARIADGAWAFRALLSEHDVASSRPRAGDRVRVRVAGAPWQTVEGEIIRVTPAGSKEIGDASLTQLAGGDIPVDGGGGKTDQPYFEITVRLSASDSRELRDGMRGQAQLEGQPEPLATSLLRRVLRAGNRIVQG